MSATSTAGRGPALPANTLLGALDEPLRSRLLAQAIPRKHKRGSVLLRRGDPGASMLLVTEGRVGVSVTSEEGREITLGILGPGDVLGFWP